MSTIQRYSTKTLHPSNLAFALALAVTNLIILVEYTINVQIIILRRASDEWP